MSAAIRDKGLVLGDPYGSAATVRIDSLWAMLQQGDAWECNKIDATFREALATSDGPTRSYANSAPVLVSAVQMSPPYGQDAFLSDIVSFSASVSDPDGDAVR